MIKNTRSFNISLILVLVMTCSVIALALICHSLIDDDRSLTVSDENGTRFIDMEHNIESTVSNTKVMAKVKTETVPESKKDLASLKSSIEDYISDFSGTYGVYYIDLVTGDEFGINETREFRAASTSKLPVNLYLYRKIEDGTIDPEQVLEFMQEDYESGTGTIQDKSFGTKYTVSETSELSIKVSDNCGINMITRLLGIENIRQYMLDIGGSVYYDDKHLTCPKDMAGYMKELYTFYVDDPEVAGKLMDDLENTIFNDRINALLPEDIVVAHKIGNQINVMNDVGIVFADGPYVLSVFSEDVDAQEACSVIANISKMIFDFVQE